MNKAELRGNNEGLYSFITSVFRVLTHTQICCSMSRHFKHCLGYLCLVMSIVHNQQELLLLCLLLSTFTFTGYSFDSSIDNNALNQMGFVQLGALITIDFHRNEMKWNDLIRFNQLVLQLSHPIPFLRLSHFGSTVPLWQSWFLWTQLQHLGQKKLLMKSRD